MDLALGASDIVESYHTQVASSTDIPALQVLIRLSSANLGSHDHSDFIVMPLIFYIIVAAARVDLWDLRHSGWIFDMGTGEHEAWYKFYSYFGTFFAEFWRLLC